MRGCEHDLVLYGTAPGELRPERAVCVECGRIVNVEFWAADRVVAFAALRADRKAMKERTR